MTYIPGTDPYPTDEYASIVLEAWDITKRCEAIGIRCTAFPIVTGGANPEWFLVRELACDGPAFGEALIKLVDSTGGDAYELYAPNSYAKVGNRAVVLNETAETEQRALAIARWFLDQGIKRFQARTYRTTDLPETLPRMGQTVEVPGGWTGVMIATPGIYLDRSGVLTLECRLLNLSGTLLD